jgi:hypothetical protein
MLWRRVPRRWSPFHARVLATYRVDQTLITCPEFEVFELRKGDIDHVVGATCLKLLCKTPGVDMKVVTIDSEDAESIKGRKRRLAFIISQASSRYTEPYHRCDFRIQEGWSNDLNPCRRPLEPEPFTREVTLIRQEEMQNQTGVNAHPLWRAL